MIIPLIADALDPNACLSNRKIGQEIYHHREV